MGQGHDHAHHDDPDVGVTARAHRRPRGQARHGHDHGGPGHVHAPARFGRAFAIGIALNGAFVVAELLAGLAGSSVALLADAGHNVGDIIGLVVAWLAGMLARRAPSARFTYGLGGSSILAALFNALLLLLAVGALSLEAVQRLLHPEPVEGGLVMAVAAAGVAVNGVTAWLFASGHEDINIRGAYLHMAADALVSVGVIVAGALILWTGWLWIDPAASLAVNLVIVLGTWGLLRDSLAMSLQGVPPGIDLAAVRAALERIPGVAAIHDLHVWSMSTTEVALTCHLTMPAGHGGDALLHEAAAALRERFGIHHVTLQVETGGVSACPLGEGHRPPEASHRAGPPQPAHAHG